MITPPSEELRRGGVRMGSRALFWITRRFTSLKDCSVSRNALSLGWNGQTQDRVWESCWPSTILRAENGLRLFHCECVLYFKTEGIAPPPAIRAAGGLPRLQEWSMKVQRSLSCETRVFPTRFHLTWACWFLHPLFLPLGW